MTVGATSPIANLPFTFTNQSATPAFSLLYGAAFTIGLTACNNGFTACTVPATFTPSNAGIQTDVVIVKDANGNVIGRMPISGIGVGPQASLAPGVATPVTQNGFLINNELAMAIDSAGYLYAVSFGSNQVFKINPLNKSATVIAGTTAAGYSGDGGPAANASLTAPSDLALDRAGHLFIADAGNNVIRQIDLATQIITTAAGTGTAGRSDTGAALSVQLTTPFLLTVDPQGNLYFLERGVDSNLTDYKVREIDAQTHTLSVFAGTGVQGNTGDNGQATQATVNPFSLKSDSASNIYITQRGLYSTSSGIVRMIANGTISRLAGSDGGQTADGGAALATIFGQIEGLSFDAAGSIYFAEGGRTIRKLAATAANPVSTVFQSSVYANYLFEGTAIDSAATLYTTGDFGTAQQITTQAAPLSFASVNASQPASPLALVYYNTGNATLNLSGLSFTGTNPGDFAQTSDCVSSLAAGASCTISIVFTPQSMGSRSANLIVADDAPGSPRTVALSGKGLSPQQAALNNTILNFGVQAGGTTSAAQTITLSNPGIAALHISGITSSSSSFAVTNNCGATLAAAAQCSISVTFSPLVNGTTIATLSVTDDASNSPQTVQLNGVGTGVTSGALFSTLNLDLGLVSIHDFGSRSFTFQSAQKTITLTSTGNGALAAFNYGTNGPNASDFSIINNCYGNVVPGSSCAMYVTFTPSGPGVRTATLQLSSYTATAGLPQTVTLTGTGFLLNKAIRGGPGYLRLSADFDGDGKADIAVWRPTNGIWYILPSSRPTQPIVVQWGASGDVPVPADYDGDGKADLAVWRPTNGTWYIVPSSHPTQQISAQWGAAGDIPLAGDFDGDGKADLAVWRQASGTWLVLPSGSPNAPISFQWGAPGDIPLAGDFDGDGEADFTVWRPSTATWYLVPSSNHSSPIAVPWGESGDTPVAADFDGDGRTDLAVWRSSTGAWWVLRSSNSASAVYQWGQPGDIPVPGDFDGDGKADYAVWRPSSATWYIERTSQPATPIVQAWGGRQDVILAGYFQNDGHGYAAAWHPDTGVWTVPDKGIVRQWGALGDIPLVGDIDGDGVADFVVWRPSQGVWYVLPGSGSSAPVIVQWGQPGDIPLLGDFDGDGVMDLTVWRPSLGIWLILPSSHPSTPIMRQWGQAGDIPLIGDFDGDLKADFIVWRPSQGTWYVLPSGSGPSPFEIQWGASGDIPVIARLNDFVRSSLLVWRPANATLYPFTSQTSLCGFNYTPVSFGAPGDLPFVLPEFFEYIGYDKLQLWRPTEGILAGPGVATPGGGPSCLVGGQEIGTPLDIPF